MSIIGSGHALLLASAAEAAPGYEISRSLRFNSGDSAYLNRTPSTAGNRRTWTWAAWVKRNKLTAQEAFFSAASSTSDRTAALFDSSGRLRFFNLSGGGVVADLVTTQVFRDPSAWYHIQIVLDTSQATDTNRYKLYVNGIQVTVFSTATYPAQDSTPFINSNVAHSIGRETGYAGEYASLMLADVHLVDGQALDPTSFGEFDATTGVWNPIAYTGSYGTNGFHLPFSDNSTAAALGKDTSDPNPINDGTVWSSITNGNFNTGASRGADKAFDGNVGGTVYAQANTGTTATVSNLGITGITSIRVNIAKNTGLDSWGTFALDSTDLTSWLQSNYAGVGNTGTWIDVTSQFTSSTLDSISITTQSNNTDDIRLAGVEINGVILRDGNSWTVNNIVASGTSTGFKAVTYTGNSSTQTISGLGFSPDLVWLKNRGSGTSHGLFDIVRGANNYIKSDDTAAENGAGVKTDLLTSFDSSGFTLGANGGGGVNCNQNGQTYVAWCWDAGSSTVSNTDGSITSSVRANQSTGFSIVTYTGNGTAGATVGHGLGAVAPQLIIAKNRDTSSNWSVYHASLGKDYFLRLNTTDAQVNSTNYWGSGGVTSTVFGVEGGSFLNTNTQKVVAYCFAPVAGISDFGSYTGNGQTLGPTVTTNFRPMLVAIKRTDSTGNWEVFDSARSLDNDLKWNTAEAEGYAPIIFNSDGFQTNYSTSSLNALNGTYIYAAFAEHVNPADIDSLLDSATNGDTANDTGLGGEVPGNYCTWNPLNKGTDVTLANGNLDMTSSSAAGNTLVLGTFGMSSGKWYWEVTGTGSDPRNGNGIAKQGVNLNSWLGSDANGWAYVWGGQKGNNGSQTSYGASYGTGDVIGIAFDADNGTLTFYKNGVSQGQAFSGLTSGPYFPALADDSGGGVAGGAANFGQRSFAYQAPTGFRPLATPFLPTPTIADGSAYMDVVTYTGNGSTQTISGLGFSPDLVWIKRRNAAASHSLFDIIRGTNNVLRTNFTGAEGTTITDTLMAFNSDGFDLGADTSYGGVNLNGSTFVAWNWDAGTFTVTNTDGSINSEVRANASAGFSIVTYTGSGSNATVGHGLGVAPAMIIVKNRDAAVNWFVYHRGIASDAETDFIKINTTDAAADLNTAWNDTAPTSTVFSIGTDGSVNQSSADHIAYCFAPVAGYSAFGSYTGNGSSTDGTFVYTGFRPKYLLLRCSSIVQLWLVYDSERSQYNLASITNQVHTSDRELDSANDYGLDFTSNGFKLRSSTDRTNGSGRNYIYAAFAENPFKYARAR